LIAFNLNFPNTGERTAITNSSFPVCSFLYRRRYSCRWHVSYISNHATI